MNTQDHLRQAINYLQQASTSTKLDIDELRRTVTARDQEAKTHLNELKQREGQRLTEAAQTDSDRTTASRLYDARMLRDEEAQVQQDFSRQKKELDNRLVMKQRHMDDINKMVQQLEQMAAQISQPIQGF